MEFSRFGDGPHAIRRLTNAPSPVIGTERRVPEPSVSEPVSTVWCTFSLLNVDISVPVMLSGKHTPIVCKFNAPEGCGLARCCLRLPIQRGGHQNIAALRAGWRRLAPQSPVRAGSAPCHVPPQGAPPRSVVIGFAGKFGHFRTFRLEPRLSVYHFHPDRCQVGSVSDNRLKKCRMTSQISS